ncbi:hypothetical protein [Methanohalophilus sp.]|uniref:hypothetical protein n=1 Tax=Methanohalophilus sp. TaxID=1966352 RepID=UPI00261299ED|nr:hypothetical protein [Methanohalophilus sp.]MDK2892066.1 hypothetical protein [Methanohalophilus sp.]
MIYYPSALGRAEINLPYCHFLFFLLSVNGVNEIRVVTAGLVRRGLFIKNVVTSVEVREEDFYRALLLITI